VTYIPIMRVVLSALVFLLAGCAARRELVINSVPPGALVRLDDTVVGTTPFETAFEAYGTRRVTLLQGRLPTQSMLVEIEPPWYGRFPLDIGLRSALALRLARSARREDGARARERDGHDARPRVGAPARRESAARGAHRSAADLAPKKPAPKPPEGPQ
jgi:hypothetical protein